MWDSDALRKPSHVSYTNVGSSRPKNMATYQYNLTIIPRLSILRDWDILTVSIPVHDKLVFDEGDLINVKWWDKETVDFNVIVGYRCNKYPSRKIS